MREIHYTTHNRFGHRLATARSADPPRAPASHFVGRQLGFTCMYGLIDRSNLATRLAASHRARRPLRGPPRTVRPRRLRRAGKDLRAASDGKDVGRRQAGSRSAVVVVAQPSPVLGGPSRGGQMEPFRALGGGGRRLLREGLEHLPLHLGHVPLHLPLHRGDGLCHVVLLRVVYARLRSCRAAALESRHSSAHKHLTPAPPTPLPSVGPLAEPLF